MGLRYGKWSSGQNASIYWGEFERKTVRFPLFLKMGKVA